MLTAEHRFRIVVAQIGARRHYAIPVLLERAGLLEAFFTDLHADIWQLRMLERTIPRKLQPASMKRLLGRRVENVPLDKIECFPWFGVRRILQERKATSPGALLRKYLRANSRFCELVLGRGLGNADTLYVFNGAGLELMQTARRRGLRVILEQTAAPLAWDELLLAEERDRWPGWEGSGASESDWWPLADREEQEWRLADSIVCGSEYVRDAVARRNGPTERCEVVPYGTDLKRFLPSSPHGNQTPLRVLFVGTIQLRKGLPYLMEAARRLPRTQVVVRAVGPIAVSRQAATRIGQALDLVGPVPRANIAEQFAWANVLVLPTLSEGSAGVCYEALATGLPVITTPNAGSVVRDGVEGCIIQIRDAEALADRILRFVNDRDLLREMSTNALRRAKEFSWERYAERLVAAISRLTLDDTEIRPALESSSSPRVL